MLPKMQPIRIGSLFSGIGGFELGVERALHRAGYKPQTLFQVEQNKFCQRVLQKHWPNVPILEDVKEIANDPDRFIPKTDWRKTILTAGYPCQPFSAAGKQKGTKDPRHIWPFIFKIVALKKPKYCVFENVNGHIALGLDAVLNDLESQNYAVSTSIIPALPFRPHKRERIWVVAQHMGDT